MSVCWKMKFYFLVDEGWERLLQGALLAVVASTMTFLNLLLLVAFLKTKQTNVTTANLIITCIMISDLISGTFALPLASYAMINADIKGCIPQAIGFVFSAGLGTVSASLTMILALDRYTHMNPNQEQPSRFKKLFKQPYISVVITLIWIFSLINPAANLLVSNSSVVHGIYTLGMAVFASVMVTVVSFLYIRGYYRIHKFVANSPVYQAEDGTVSRPRYLCRLYRTVLVLLIVIIVSFIPFSVGHITISIYIFFEIDNGKDVVLTLLRSTLMFLFLNRILTPVIVLWQNKDARQWICRQTCTVPSRHRQSQNNVVARSTNCIEMEKV